MHFSFLLVSKHQSLVYRDLIQTSPRLLSLHKPPLDLSLVRPYHSRLEILKLYRLSLQISYQYERAVFIEEFPISHLNHMLLLHHQPQFRMMARYRTPKFETLCHLLEASLCTFPHCPVSCIELIVYLPVVVDCPSPCTLSHCPAGLQRPVMALASRLSL